MPINEFSAKNALSKAAFHRELLKWLLESDDLVLDATSHERKKIVQVRDKGRLFGLDAGTSRDSVKIYLDEIVAEFGDDVRWSIVPSQRGKMSAVAYGPSRLRCTPFYLYLLHPIESLSIENAGSESTVIFPDEETEKREYPEGCVKQVLINQRERNPKARSACLRHYGYECVVCEQSLDEIYGQVAVGLIHVHHLNPLSSILEESEIDPIQDLRPVCPNCHMVLHIKNPPYTIEEARQFFNKINS